MTHATGSTWLYGILALVGAALFFGAGLWIGLRYDHRGHADEAAVPALSDYERATEAYVSRHYAEAIELARRSTDPRRQRIIGAASCFLGDARTAREAATQLDAPGRQFLGYVCSRNHITIR